MAVGLVDRLLEVAAATDLVARATVAAVVVARAAVVMAQAVVVMATVLVATIPWRDRHDLVNVPTARLQLLRLMLVPHSSSAPQQAPTLRLGEWHCGVLPPIPEGHSLAVTGEGSAACRPPCTGAYCSRRKTDNREKAVATAPHTEVAGWSR